MDLGPLDLDRAVRIQWIQDLIWVVGFRSSGPGGLGAQGGGAARRRRRPRGGARLGLTGLGQTWPSGHEIERGLALETARRTGKAPRASAGAYDGRSRACVRLGGSAAVALAGVAHSRDSGLDSSSARAEGDRAKHSKVSGDLAQAITWRGGARHSGESPCARRRYTGLVFQPHGCVLNDES